MHSVARRAHLHPGDVHGIARLATDATRAVTDIVEAMHERFSSPPLGPRSGRAGGIAGLAYSGVRGVTWLVGSSIALAAPPLVPLFGERISTPERDALMSVLNGVVGDHLAATANPLAITMRLRRSGTALDLHPGRLAGALPHVTSRI